VNPFDIDLSPEEEGFLLAMLMFGVVAVIAFIDIIVWNYFTPPSTTGQSFYATLYWVGLFALLIPYCFGIIALAYWMGGAAAHRARLIFATGWMLLFSQLEDILFFSIAPLIRPGITWPANFYWLPIPSFFFGLAHGVWPQEWAGYVKQWLTTWTLPTNPPYAVTPDELFIWCGFWLLLILVFWIRELMEE
jgi:hypothetical protein